MTPRPLSRIVYRIILLWLFLPGLIAILLLGAYIAHERIESFAEAGESFAGSLARYVESYLDEAFATLEMIGLHLGDRAEALKTEALATPGHIAHFRRLLHVDGHGDILASMPLGSEGEHFGLSFDVGEPSRLILSRPAPSQDTGRLVLYIGRRADDGSLLTGELDLEAFQHHLSALLVPEQSFLIITDAHGNLITHPDLDRVMTQGNIGGDPLFTRARQGYRLILTRDPSSHALFVASAWLMPLTGWRIFVLKPLADVAMPVLTPLALFMCLSMLFFTLLTVFLHRGLARHIVLPLDSFVESMRRLARGEQDTRAPSRATSRELMTVLHTFRAMALRMRKRERELTSSRELFRQLVENMEEVFWVQELPSGRLSYVSPSAAHVLGRDALESGGPPAGLLDAIHHEDAPRVNNALERAGNMCIPAEEEFRIVQPPHGEVRWLRLRAYPVRGPWGKARALVGFMQDVTEKKRLDEALSHVVSATATVTGERFFPAIAEHLAQSLDATHAIISTYVDSPPTRARPLAFWGRGRLLEGAEYDLEGTPCRAVPEQGLAVVRSGLAEAYPQDALLRQERLESYLGVALYDFRGMVVGHVAVLDEKPLLDEARSRSVLAIFSARVASEIERRAALARMEASLAEKEILLKEIHHRVKNNLQVISSLMSLQAASSGNAELASLLADSRNRVRAMALVHEEIYRSADLSRVDVSRYLRNLLDTLLAGVSAGRSISLSLDAQDISLPVNLAVPCGLIINELFTNTLKHAFPEHGRGHVQVSMSRAPDGQITLTMRDNGVGLPLDMDFTATETLGLHLVVNLVRQLDGSMKLLPGPGAAFSIRFRDSQGGDRRPMPPTPALG